jgi:hypothetical protein
MTMFDLLFILLFLTSVGVLLAALIALLRGWRERAGRIVLRWAICAAVYLMIVYAVVLTKPRRYLSVGDERCWDDWCAAVDGATRTPDESGAVYTAKIRLFSRARGADQRVNGVQMYLTDSQGRRWDPEPAESETPFDTLLHAGESKITTRNFHVPSDAHEVGLVMLHGMGAPVCLIIGEEGCVSSKRTVIRLD